MRRTILLLTRWWRLGRAASLLLLMLTACEKPATPPAPGAQQSLPMDAAEAALLAPVRPRPQAPPRGLPMYAAEATLLARQLANQHALALYRCEPFLSGPAAVWTNEHWLWRARQGFGHSDIEALVSLAPDGSTQSVQVLLLHSRMDLPPTGRSPQPP